MNIGPNKMESHLTGLWVNFFTTAGIPSDVAATYALTFAENRIQNDMLLDLNKEYLRDMGITRMGDVIAILRHAKMVHESTARDRVLGSAAAAKVPVAAVTGRATVAQPSSPASRMLEHYTRNSLAKEPSPVAVPQLKRKSTQIECNSDAVVKKTRLIRFGTRPQAAAVKEGISKQTVFARLGTSEPTKTVAAVKTVAAKPEVKPVFARLGSKAEEAKQDIPMPKDALKYEGILKAAPVKKLVTITTTKNNVRRIAVGCTMRADETPLSVKDKLDLPRAKSVKFANTIQYKEIEAKTEVKTKFTPVFNKPERRLSMPEGAINVKSRLGVTKNANNLTITKNVFNRLGA